MEMVGDIMKMREVDGIELKAGSKISMKPGGGYHIMLVGLKHPLIAGDKFMLTLYFEKAGKIEVVVHVEADSPTN
jgi:copper(I)-binding protein